MADNRITKERVKNHFFYGWWKYVLAVVLCVFGIDMIFAMTAYRPPEDKKTEWFVLNGYMDAERMEQDFFPVIQSVCPEQEALTVMSINLNSEDPYTRMQFTTYTAAGQGDMALMPANEWRRLSQEDVTDVFVDLTPYIQSGVIDVSGLDLTAYSRDGGIYGIPADGLGGLNAYGNDPRGSCLCIMAYSGNQDTAAAAIGRMLREFEGENTFSEKEDVMQEPIFSR